MRTFVDDASSTKRAVYVRDVPYCRGLRFAGDDGVVNASAAAIFLPAAIVAGRLRCGLEFLKEYGFQLLCARVVQLNEDQVAELWRYQIPTFRPDRWSVALGLFQAGPSVVVTMRRRSRGNVSASRYLMELKGPSNPLQTTGRHLRTRMGAMNKINNLIHSPTDSLDLIRELAILLSDEELRQAWRLSSMAPVADGLVDTERFVDSIGVGTRKDGVSFAHALIGLRWRIFTAWMPWLVDGRIEQARGIRAALDAELRWRRRTSAVAPVAALKEYQQRFREGQLRREVERLTEGIPRARLLASAFREVEKALFDDRWSSREVCDALGAAEVTIDPWEYLIIASQDVSRTA